MIGGSIRVPSFQKALRDGLHRDILDMHLNGDETVALGAAFRAANLSRAFKPRFVGISDICPFSIDMELYREQPEAEPAPASEEETSEEEEAGNLEEPVEDAATEKQRRDFLLRSKGMHRSKLLYLRGSHYKTQRKITVPAYEDFKVHLSYSRMEELPAHAVWAMERGLMCRSPIATYNITGIAEGIASIGEKRRGQPNVTLIFINDMNGIVYLKEAFMKVRYEYPEEVEVEKPKNVLKSPEQGEEGKKETSEEAAPAAAEAQQTEEAAATNQAEPEKETQNPTETETETETDPDADAEAETESAKNTAENTPAEDVPANGNASESTKETKSEKEIVLVMKRKVRKIPLHFTSLLDRLVILPMTDAERQRSTDL